MTVHERGYPVDLELLHPEQTDAALAAVRRERARQDIRWGDSSHDYGQWLAILAEEVGKVARAIVKMIEPDGLRNVWREELRGRLVNVAAVSVAAVERLDREDTQT